MGFWDKHINTGGKCMTKKKRDKSLKILDRNIQYHEQKQKQNLLSVPMLLGGIFTLSVILMKKLVFSNIEFDYVIYYYALFYNISMSGFQIINVIFRPKSMTNLTFGNYDRFTKKSHLIGHFFDLVFMTMAVIANGKIVYVVNVIDLEYIVFSIFLFIILAKVIEKLRIIKRDYLLKSEQKIDKSSLEEEKKLFESYRYLIMIVVIFYMVLIILSIYLFFKGYSIKNWNSMSVSGIITIISVILDFISVRLADASRLNWLNKIKKDIELHKDIDEEIKKIILNEEFNNFKTELFVSDD